METFETRSRQLLWPVITAFALIVASRNAFATGGDYPKDRRIDHFRSWLGGMEELVNTTNLVHAYWVNAEDIFFFSGTATNFADFLRDYSRIRGLQSRRLILHDGVGEAKSPWQKTGRPCDWKLYACPKSWHNLMTLSEQATNSTEVIQKAFKESGDILEVHLWFGGRIALDQATIPQNVEIKKYQ